MKKFLPYVFVIIVLFAVGYFISHRDESEENTISRQQLLLGTLVKIEIDPAGLDEPESVIEEAFEAIYTIDSLFSTYNEASPIFKFNHSKDTIAHFREEIYKLIVLSDSITSLTNGAFDISLENLTALWDFNSGQPYVPDSSKIDSVMRHYGWQNIEIKKGLKIIRRNDVSLNFGAIAKGYAVDSAIKFLKSKNVKSAIVNAGGEVKTIGEGHIVGIQHPRIPGKIITGIKSNGKAVATSGDYEKYFIIDKERYHHLLDPATGYPAHGLQSVTVVSSNAAFADALATGIFIMGLDSGMRLVENLAEVEAMVIDNIGHIHYSAGMKKLLVK